MGITRFFVPIKVSGEELVHLPKLIDSIHQERALQDARPAEHQMGKIELMFKVSIDSAVKAKDTENEIPYSTMNGVLNMFTHQYNLELRHLIEITAHFESFSYTPPVSDVAKRVEQYTRDVTYR